MDPSEDELALDREAIDEFFDDAAAPDAPAEDLLYTFQGFVAGYQQKLAEIQEAISDRMARPQTWDGERDAVRLDTEPRDSAVVQAMVRTENVQFNKVVTVFAVLCREMRGLTGVAEERFFGALTMFGHTGEEPDEDEDDEEGAGRGAADEQEAPEVLMGRYLPLFQELYSFLRRSYQVVRSVVNQLACLYHERQKLYISTFKHVRLSAVFDALGGLLRALVTLDAIVADNASIPLAWGTYKRMIKYVRTDPDRYAVREGDLRAFEGMLVQLDRVVMSANMFRGCLSQSFSLPGAASSRALVEGNRVLYDHLRKYVKARVHEVTPPGGVGEASSADAAESFERTALVEVAAVYALHRRLFRQTAKPDRSTYKAVWELQRRVPVVPLYGRAVWFAAEFLGEHAPLDYKGVTPSPRDVMRLRRQAMQRMDENFAADTEVLYQRLCMWMVRVESELVPTSESNIAGVLAARAKLMLAGLLLANQVRNLVASNLALHASLGVPFVAGNVRSIALCAEMLKSVEYTFHRRSRMIGENVPHMLGQTAFTLRRLLVPVKRRLEQAARSRGGKLKDDQLDALAAANLALTALGCAPSADRRTVVSLALSVAGIKGLLKQAHADEAAYQLEKLQQLAEWQRRVRRACDCSFLYWSAALVPAFFADIFEHPDQANRLQYLLAALRDAGSYFWCFPAEDLRRRHLAGFQDEVAAHLQREVVEPLCREVENDLRLHIHSVVLEQPSLHRAVRDLSRFIGLKPLCFFDRVVDVKRRVTHYLDQTFYNLTTVTLHDSRVYAEMRNLAYEKYGLSMAEVHLPGHAHYSEALDVLEIMRNIHIFVARYNYNMNTQTFCERALDQAHLNTINIEHIANSIRTHGTGIMNTTVNFTYQFLCRKFVIFSEFLFDDHIKSRLLKDIRYFKNERERLENMYPYERAEKFNAQIRRLGVSDDGQSFLDQFRQQITEIGNALGYVRMVRSGGMEYCSNAIKFVPDLEAVPDFEAGAAGLSTETTEAARNLAVVLDDLGKNFAEGTEYFSVLVKIFEGALLNERQAHLRNFYAIAPALTLNFVEKMLAQKDTLHKKGGRGEASFTDDGFALGMAYILKLLHLDAQFDSLHWFESANTWITQRIHQLEKRSSNKKHSSEDVQHMQLTVKRLRAIKDEFEMLFYSFSGSRIFFREVESRADAGAAGAAGAAAAEPDEEKSAEPDGGAATAGAPPAPAPPAPPAPPAGSIPAAPSIPQAPPLAF